MLNRSQAGDFNERGLWGYRLFYCTGKQKKSVSSAGKKWASRLTKEKINCHISIPIVFEIADGFSKIGRREIGIDLLEQISLRELRGKGVAVWLLTQNPRDLNQPHYNYVSEINYHLCLRVLDVSPRILSNIYGVPINEAKAWSAKLATFDQEGICRSPASSKGFSKVKIRQFWER